MQNTNKSTKDNPDEEKQKDIIKQAHEAADKDIEQDPDLSMEPKPGDDLDEGELARFEHPE